jgi:hypothetical protein
VSQATGTVRRVDPQPQTPRVTASLLRRAAVMCRRRLKHEHTGDKRSANPAANARFAVSNRLSADARLAQTELGPPRAEAFVDPRDLEPEQQALYRAAVQGYLAEFGDRPGRAVDLGWHTHIEEAGVDLVGDPGIALELPDGRRELRVLSYGTRARGPSLYDVDRRVALVRTSEWAPEQLTIVAVDLIDCAVTRDTPDLERERAEALTWIAERSALVKELAADGRARAGADCAGCPFIAGCPQFRSRA